MPVERGGFVPGSVVEDEDAPFSRIGRDLFGEVIEVKLEDVGIDPVENHLETLAGGRTDRANNVATDGGTKKARSNLGPAGGVWQEAVCCLRPRPVRFAAPPVA